MFLFGLAVGIVVGIIIDKFWMVLEHHFKDDNDEDKYDDGID